MECWEEKGISACIVIYLKEFKNWWDLFDSIINKTAMTCCSVSYVTNKTMHYLTFFASHPCVFMCNLRFWSLIQVAWKNFLTQEITWWILRKFHSFWKFPSKEFKIKYIVFRGFLDCIWFCKKCRVISQKYWWNSL